jgi:RNA polymerase II subunit A C-terminal domain phosphatase SSU72
MSGEFCSPLKIAVVCSSNMNRSMEAHAFLQKKGFQVDSYGTGDKVKLPGPAADKPNVYDFGITYEEIHEDLVRKDRSLYTQNGILHMLDRNKRIKARPSRLQEATKRYDIIITAEERVYDQTLEYFEENGNVANQPVHVINMDITDNHEEATIGAFMLCELVQMLANSEDLDNEIDELVQEFEARHRPLLHTVLFY